MKLTTALCALHSAEDAAENHVLLHGGDNERTFLVENKKNQNDTTWILTLKLLVLKQNAVSANSDIDELISVCLFPYK